MGRIICVANEKGGVGKTTTSGALAAAFQQKGFRVLAVDMDPQTNLSFSMGADCMDRATVYNVMKGELKTRFAIQRTNVTDILPASAMLSSLELEFTGAGRQFLLKDALEPVAKDYDYIVIDAPPALGILTANAFTAADCVLVPVTADIFSLQGTTKLFDTFEQVRDRSNPSLYIAGILLIKYNPKVRLSHEIMRTAQMMAQDFEVPLLETYIHTRVALSEAQVAQMSIFDYAPKNQAALDFLQLADELIQRGVK